jgi:hypothetical protein
MLTPAHSRFKSLRQALVDLDAQARKAHAKKAALKFTNPVLQPVFLCAEEEA